MRGRGRSGEGFAQSLPQSFLFRAPRSWPASNFHDYSFVRLLGVRRLSFRPLSGTRLSLLFSRRIPLSRLFPVKLYGQNYLFTDLSVFYYTRSFHALPYLLSCLLYDIYSCARLYSAPVITELAGRREGRRCTKYRENELAARSSGREKEGKPSRKGGKKQPR